MHAADPLSEGGEDDLGIFLLQEDVLPLKATPPPISSKEFVTLESEKKWP